MQCINYQAQYNGTVYSSFNQASGLSVSVIHLHTCVLGVNINKPQAWWGTSPSVSLRRIRIAQIMNLWPITRQRISIVSRNQDLLQVCACVFGDMAINLSGHRPSHPTIDPAIHALFNVCLPIHPPIQPFICACISIHSFIPLWANYCKQRVCDQHKCQVSSWKAEKLTTQPSSFKHVNPGLLHANVSIYEPYLPLRIRPRCFVKSSSVQDKL